MCLSSLTESSRTPPYHASDLLEVLGDEQLGCFLQVRTVASVCKFPDAGTFFQSEVIF